MIVNPYAEYAKSRFNVAEMAGLGELGQFDAFGSMFPGTTTPAATPWWQTLIGQVTGIVGSRIGPAPGVYERDPSGRVIIRQPEGSRAPVAVPGEVIVQGRAQSDTSTGLILAAVGVGVLVLMMSRR